LFLTATRLYGRYLGLFLLLAGLFVVPFDVVDLSVTGSAHWGSTLTSHQEHELLLLVVVDFVLIIPLVSALQVQAVALIGEGESPRLSEIFRRCAPIMLTVVAASIITAIGVGAGLVLILPGIWLLLRLYVVAQTAAIEGTDWPSTLRRSFTLTRGSSWRILGVLLIVGLINVTLDNVAISVANSAGSVARDIVMAVVTLLSQSFSALLGAVLYFDLRARDAASAAR
jgi:hypothetical protein